jgi:hypothetical protein
LVPYIDAPCWRTILADASGPEGTELNLPLRAGFGTVSSAMIFLGREPAWLFAPGPPHRAAYAPVPLPGSPPALGSPTVLA